MASMLKRRKKILDERGFSLLELMIALVILAIGVLMLTGMQFTTINANANGYKMSTATALGERLMERLKLLNFADSQLSAAPFTGTITVGGVVYFPVTVNGVSYTGSYLVTNDTPITGMKRVDLTVSWVDNGNHSVTLTGRIAP